MKMHRIAQQLLIFGLIFFSLTEAGIAGPIDFTCQEIKVQELKVIGDRFFNYSGWLWFSIVILLFSAIMVSILSVGLRYSFSHYITSPKKRIKPKRVIYSIMHGISLVASLVLFIYLSKYLLSNLVYIINDAFLSPSWSEVGAFSCVENNYTLALNGKISLAMKLILILLIPLYILSVQIMQLRKKYQSSK